MRLPPKLFLGQIDRPLDGGIGAADEVRTAHDLPSRLFHATLVQDSFTARAGIWQAHYSGRESEIDLQWDGQRLTLSQRWHERRAITTIGRSRIADLAQAALVHARWWTEILDALDPPLNLFVETGDCERGTTVFYPDGLLLTVLVPIPVRQLDGCLPLVEEWVADSDFLAPLSAELRLGWSVVNYLEGQCSLASLPAGAVDERTAQLFGMPPVAPAVFETRREGPGALTVRRQHCELVIDVFLCDLTLLLRRLAARGIIAARYGTAAICEEYPAAPEYSAVVLPTLMGPAVRQLVFFDGGRTRRVVYPGPIRCVEPDSTSVID